MQWNFKQACTVHFVLWLRSESSTSNVLLLLLLLPLHHPDRQRQLHRSVGQDPGARGREGMGGAARRHAAAGTCCSHDPACCTAGGPGCAAHCTGALPAGFGAVGCRCCSAHWALLKGWWGEGRSKGQKEINSGDPWHAWSWLWAGGVQRCEGHMRNCGRLCWQLLCFFVAPRPACLAHICHCSYPPLAATSAELLASPHIRCQWSTLDLNGSSSAHVAHTTLSMQVLEGRVTDPFIRNWLDLLSFLLSGLPANGTIAAEVAYMFNGGHGRMRSGCRVVSLQGGV